MAGKDIGWKMRAVDFGKQITLEILNKIGIIDLPTRFKMEEAIQIFIEGSGYRGTLNDVNYPTTYSEIYNYNKEWG